VHFLCTAASNRPNRIRDAPILGCSCRSRSWCGNEQTRDLSPSIAQPAWYGYLEPRQPYINHVWYWLPRPAVHAIETVQFLCTKFSPQLYVLEQNASASSFCATWQHTIHWKEIFHGDLRACTWKNVNGEQTDCTMPNTTLRACFEAVCRDLLILPRNVHGNHSISEANQQKVRRDVHAGSSIDAP
jgi:hypothetical protein